MSTTGANREKPNKNGHLSRHRRGDAGKTHAKRVKMTNLQKAGLETLKRVFFWRQNAIRLQLDIGPANGGEQQKRRQHPLVKSS